MSKQQLRAELKQESMYYYYIIIIVVVTAAVDVVVIVVEWMLKGTTERKSPSNREKSIYLKTMYRKLWGGGGEIIRKYSKHFIYKFSI